MHRRIDPSFLVTRTTGDAQLLFQGSMTPSVRSLFNSCFRAWRLTSASLCGPSFTRAFDTIVMPWWTTEVWVRSSLHFAKSPANSARRTSAMTCSSGVSRSWDSSSNFWSWSGRVSYSSGTLDEERVWLTLDTGSHTPTWVSWKRTWGSVLMFITLKGRTPSTGFTTTWPKTTLPSHKWRSLESTITWVNGGVSSIFPGTIISDIGGMVTVSATVIRNVQGMASMHWHTWVVLSTESTPAPTFKVHWCDRRKSTPMMTGTSIS